MTTPFILRPEHSESLVCPDPRPGWRGVEPATIRLGRWADGQWSKAVSAHTSMIGTGSSVSEWSDGRPLPRYASRADALDAAVDKLLEVAAGFTGIAADAEVARIRSWALEQRSQQGDLFSMAA